MRSIKVMAEYGAFPIWRAGDEAGDGDVDPDTLPLSKDLKLELKAWARHLDQTLNWDNPANTAWPQGFWSDFNRQGEALWARVRAELADKYEVIWHSWGRD